MDALGRDPNQSPAGHPKGQSTCVYYTLPNAVPETQCIYNIKSERGCELWSLVILTHQYRFTDRNKCISTEDGVGNGGGCTCVNRECVGNLCIFLQFCCKPKAVLKK